MATSGLHCCALYLRETTTDVQTVSYWPAYAERWQAPLLQRGTAASTLPGFGAPADAPSPVWRALMTLMLSQPTSITALWQADHGGAH